MPDGSTQARTARRDAFAQRRKALGLTQEDLADLLGVERSTVVRWERGETEPRPWIRSRLASSLGVSADQLEALLAAAPPGSGRGHPGKPDVPRQLPAAVANFTGRTVELDTLTRLLDKADDGTPGITVISAIGGTAGVGKTALAVHWAHQAAGRFPDGQMYMNLRGYDPDEPVPAGDALAGFLRSLGVPGREIPPDTEERAARYRSLLAGKRMLIVLDNAGSADHVRPLLPGNPACAVVVTSRDALAGLVARDGATRLDLDALGLSEAVALLRALVGARVDEDPDAAAELAGLCCRLPLALRVAAELAVSRPAASLAGLVGELADLRTRLDLLAAGGDCRTEVRAVFSWSYRQLDADAARIFRLLGLHPGADIEPYAVAALAGETVARARRALDTLTRAHLLSPAAPGRYGMHDLLRSYALELTAAEGDSGGRRAALTRLFDHYLHTAATAMDALFPAERHRRPRVRRPATPVPPVDGAAAAREWLDRERAVLVAVAGYCAAHGWPGHAARLAATLSRYLGSGGHLSQARALFTHALGAARRAGDRAAEARALQEIGNVDSEQGLLQHAVDRYRQALALFRAAGDRAGEARSLRGTGVVEVELGRYEQACRHQREAAAICRDIGDRFGEAHALGSLGLALQRQGRYQEAARCHRQSLDLSREIGYPQGEFWALARLGADDLRHGRFQQAAGNLGQALALARETGDKGGEAAIGAKLGEAYLGLGRCEQAAGSLTRALAIVREIGDPVQEASALNGLGEILHTTGAAEEAHARHAAALRLASEADSPHQRARAHGGLARACQARGDTPGARRHWQEALALYTDIGAPEADQVRTEMGQSAAAP